MNDNIAAASGLVTCDSAECSAMGKIHTYFKTGSLLFCAHHSRQYSPAMHASYMRMSSQHVGTESRAIFKLSGIK